MDALRIVRRIYDNLSWPAAFDLPDPDCSGDYLWGRIEALWREPDQTFVTILYPLLLGRAADAEGLAEFCASLAAGALRSAVVRRIALSREARESGLGVSWMPRLADLEKEALWPRLRALWRARDRAFVEGLYPLLLGRLPDEPGAAGFTDLLTAGAPRAEVVRHVALSDEAKAARLDVSWLPRVVELGRDGRRFSFRSLALLLRRWLGVWKRLGRRGRRKDDAPQQQAAPDEARRAA